MRQARGRCGGVRGTEHRLHSCALGDGVWCGASPLHPWVPARLQLPCWVQILLCPAQKSVSQVCPGLCKALGEKEWVKTLENSLWVSVLRNFLKPSLLFLNSSLAVQLVILREGSCVHGRRDRPWFHPALEGHTGDICSDLSEVRGLHRALEKLLPRPQALS